ncbi:hypothetical protein AVEN_189690-1 [Araneus ventricosus]|uniref:Uncharacterized protein n=1 Tax=Araneus ventricosus TaxID=182803 RepID=A0A4Y2NG64_ARAVE|nr:hypothetical protein AVEN_189690-1 [Araneus ventricosus]
MNERKRCSSPIPVFLPLSYHFFLSTRASDGCTYGKSLNIGEIHSFFYGNEDTNFAILRLLSAVSGFIAVRSNYKGHLQTRRLEDHKSFLQGFCEMKE